MTINVRRLRGSPSQPNATCLLAIVARRRRTAHTCKAAGFTLIELMAVLTVAVVLLMVAVPSFQAMLRTNRIAALTNELTTALQYARSEAVSRGAQVTLCKSADTADSTPTCQASAKWQDGWIVFVDNNGNGNLDGADAPLKIGQPSAVGAVIDGATNFGEYIRFLPSGQSAGSTGPNGTLSICIAPDQRSIILNNVGRLRVDRGTCT